jgi:hypothetical protein
MDGNPPYNWCDRQCERCPLVATCELGRLCGSASREGGDEADDIHAVIAELEKDLARRIALLESAAVEEPPSSSAPLSDERAEPPSSSAPRAEPVGASRPPGPVPVLASKLNDSGRAYFDRAEALVRIIRAGDPERLASDPNAVALRSCALLTTMKLARLASHLELGGNFDCDVAPNRLLLETVGDSARRLVEQLRVNARPSVREALDGCDAARVEIDRLLELAFGPIPQGARTELERRIAEGCAPSPFCLRRPSQT